jgi:hypothetical protein
MMKFITHAAAGLLILAGTATAETTTPMGQTVIRAGSGHILAAPPSNFTGTATVRRLVDLARTTSPLSVWPPRSTRFGSPLVLSRVHWVEPKLVAEVTYLTWTADNPLRHTVYIGLREDKPADQVRREAESQ